VYGGQGWLNPLGELGILPRTASFVEEGHEAGITFFLRKHDDLNLFVVEGGSKLELRLGRQKDFESPLIVFSGLV
jgi:hypothetical protein